MHHDEFHYIPMSHMMMDYFSLSLYFPSLDSSTVTPESDTGPLGKLEHYRNVALQVQGFLDKVCRHDCKFTFGYGRVFNKGMVANAVGFRSFCLFGQMLTPEPMGWNQPEMAVPLFIGRSIDCQTILFTNAASDERAMYDTIAVSYGSCEPTDIERLFDSSKRLAVSMDRSVSMYICPNVEPNNRSLFVSCCICRDDTQGMMHDAYERLGLAPTTTRMETAVYVFTKRKQIDDMMKKYKHIGDEVSNLERSPAGGAISVRWYKGGQYLPLTKRDTEGNLENGE